MPGLSVGEKAQKAEPDCGLVCAKNWTGREEAMPVWQENGTGEDYLASSLLIRLTIEANSASS